MVNEEEDEILKRLNEQLETEAKEKRINNEVDKRRKQLEEEEEGEEEAEPKEAVFLDSKKKRRRVTRSNTEKTVCTDCGSTNLKVLGIDVIYKRKGEQLYHFSEVLRCRNCGHKFGVTKE